jgi:hypothetical protein
MSSIVETDVSMAESNVFTAIVQFTVCVDVVF